MIGLLVGDGIIGYYKSHTGFFLCLSSMIGLLVGDGHAWSLLDIIKVTLAFFFVSLR